MDKGRIRRQVLGVLGVATLFVAACGGGGGGGGGGSSEAPNTATLGIWQEPNSFLAAGITDSLTYSYVIDAVSNEGLLWYKSEDDTASAKTIADYWAPDLATEVPTTANGDVKTSGCPNPAAKMCVTWKLRSGVKWHDGSTFGPHDVCDTFQLYWLKYGLSGGKNPSPLLTTSGWDQTIDCKEDTAGNTATIDYKAIYAPYLGIATGVYGIIPAKVLDDVFAKNADLTKQSETLDLTQGSGNSAAFKGSSTMDKVIDGTGPFVFSSYTKGQQFVFVKNKNYWNKDHQPKLDKIVFKVESGLDNEVNGIKSGDIDFGFDMRLNNLKTLTDAAAGGKIKVQTVPDSGAEKIDLNMCLNDGNLCGTGAYKNPYTADKTIRHAMLQALDRKAIIQDQAEGKTVVPRDSWMYLGTEWIDDPSIPTTAYDPEAAKKALDAAGYTMDPNDCTVNGTVYRKFKDGTCIAVNIGTTSNNSGRVAVEREVEKYLGAIGIRVLEPFSPNKPAGDFFDSFSNHGPLYTHQFDMAMYTNTVSSPAEPDSWYAGYHGDCGGSCPDNSQIPNETNGGNGQNSTGENNPVVDQALDQGRNSVDLTERAVSYKKAEHALADDLPELPLFQQVTVDAYSSQLQNVAPNDIVWDFNIVDWSCTNNQCNQQ